MQKTILLTGATDGIGLATATKLVSLGHRVLLHGRNHDKLKTVAATLSSNGPEPGTYVADLSDLSEVENLATEISSDFSQLDILINNAGVLKTPHPITDNGQDVRFVVNTIAPYLLTQKLLPLLPADGRVINLSSAAQSAVNLNALSGGQKLSDMEAYAQSKLAITMWTRHLAIAHENGPSFIAVNPGSLLASKMVKEGFGVAGNDLQIGADILVRAALSDEFDTVSGQYFDNDLGQFAQPHTDALNGVKVSEVVKAIEAQLNG